MKSESGYGVVLFSSCLKTFGYLYYVLPQQYKSGYSPCTDLVVFRKDVFCILMEDQ